MLLIVKLEGAKHDSLQRYKLTETSFRSRFRSTHTKNTRNIFLIFEFQSLTFTENHKKHWREKNYDELTKGSLQYK